MKSCPQCSKTFPDSEQFCDADGSALVAAAATECPVCGGKAEPGEVMCNFCGTRLDVGGAGARPSGPPGGASSQKPATMKTTFDDEPPSEPKRGGRRVFGTIGFVVAASAALAVVPGSRCV